MILYFVLIGFVTGTVGAWFVLQTGAGILLALLAYSFAGALGVVVSAVAFAFAPTLPRPRRRGGLPVHAHPVHARSASRVSPARPR
ncbi:MAG: hypothetical protein R3D80_09235 [Paracoccaceae bacterium]|nr:hypothetical protein [Maritimibacter sp.]